MPNSRSEMRRATHLRGLWLIAELRTVREVVKTFEPNTGRFRLTLFRHWCLSTALIRSNISPMWWKASTISLRVMCAICSAAAVRLYKRPLRDNDRLPDIGLFRERKLRVREISEYIYNRLVPEDPHSSNPAPTQSQP